MTKNKKWLVGLLIFFGIIFVFQFFIYFIKNDESATNPDINQPVFSPTLKVEKDTSPVFSGEVFRMPTKEGGFLELKNPMKNNKYPLGENAALIEEEGEYNIEFQNLPEGPLFYLVINDRDIQKARDMAEKALLDYLGINQEKACQIKVDVIVIWSVNERAAGSGYGLSFCPDGKPFPSDWRKY